MQKPRKQEKLNANNRSIVQVDEIEEKVKGIVNL